MEAASSIRRPPVGPTGFLRSMPLAPLVLPVLVVAGTVVVLALVRVAGTSWTELAGPAVLLVAATVAEAFPVPIVGVKAGSTSLATIPIVVTGATYGWPPAALVGAATMLLVELRRRMPLLKTAYNASMYALGGAAAGAACGLLPSNYRLGLLGAAAFYLVNIGLLAAVVARSNHAPYAEVVRSFIASTVTPFVVMASTTAILVELWMRAPILSLFLVPPSTAIAVYQRKLVAAMERQRELDRLKDEFVAVVSHELRTPLAAVYGGVETLQRRSLSDATRERLFEVIRHEAGRLTKLVDDVLWASRLDARRNLQVLSPFDPVGLVEDAVVAAAEADPGHTRLVVVPSGPLPWVLADREHAQRVLANLLENAVKYSPDGGTIEVGANVAGEAIRFKVTDQGIGVAANERDRIFEKFTRLDPQMSGGISGTGLGLYICRQLVEQMGGRIWVESNHPKGSSFSFELPLADG
jgi:signal transduction histidine kinase